MWVRAVFLALAAIAASSSAGCQILGDLQVKELITDAPSSDAGSSSSDPPARDAGVESGPPVVVLPKRGCTEGRPGATNDCAGTRDCCERKTAPAGTFYLRTGTIDDQGPDDTSRPAELSAFTMDSFEVTVGRFRAFVEAGGGVQASAPKVGSGAHPSKAESGWRESFLTYLPRERGELEGQLAQSRFATWSPKPEGREQHPIAGVSWFLAMAFCIWDGARLPTDAEWAYAAAGGDEQRLYPWGPDLVIDPAVWQCGDKYGSPFMYASCSAVDLLPVGSRPNGRARWGHEDLLGNADEWLLDIFCAPPTRGLCKDCVTTGACFQRTSRGGDVRMLVTEAGQTYSRWRQASEPSTGKGFRCVRSTP